MTETHRFLERQGLPRLAYHRLEGSGPTVVWLGGFRSDMGGTKAVALAEAARRGGWPLLRFDYRAHGASEGRWEDCTIGDWRRDSLDAVDRLTEGPLVLVGSSMGGWMACLTALARPGRVKAMVLVAPAPDFTERLMRPQLSPEALRELELSGVWMEPSAYDEPFAITRRFLDEGRDWNILDGEVAIDCPVAVLQGAQDPDVPWRHALELAEKLRGREVTFTLVKAGDHRLSTPADLDRLVRTVEALRA